MFALCAPWNVICKAKEAIVDFIKDSAGWFWDNIVTTMLERLSDWIIQVISDAVIEIIKVVSALWLSVPTIDMGNSGPIKFMHDATSWLVVTFAIVGVIIGGAKMAWTQRGDDFRALAKSLLTMMVVSSMALTTLSLLVDVGDKYSDWVVNAALSGSTLGDTLSGFIQLQDGLSLTLVILLGIAAIAVAFIQLILMLVRAAGLALVAVALPLSCAATNTELGMHWFKRIVGYLVMFVAYKPAAATVYAAAIAMANQQPDNAGDAEKLVNVITGVTLMVLAVLLMPAMMRLVAPASAK